MLKKYHLWWLISTAIFSFMAANYLLFALTGLMPILPNTNGQAFVQIIFFICTAVVSIGCSLEDSHIKK